MPGMRMLPCMPGSPTSSPGQSKTNCLPSDSRTACAVIIPSIIDDVQHILVEASPSIKQPRLSWVPPLHFRFAQHDRRPRGAVNCARLLGCCSFGGPSYNIYLSRLIGELSAERPYGAAPHEVTPHLFLRHIGKC